MTACLVTVAMLVPAAATAQVSVSSTDIQRLQDDVYQASSDLSRARGMDASSLQTELDELREEVIYLKVKLRKTGTVSRNEYADVRERLSNLRSRARGDMRDMRETRDTRDPRDTRDTTGERQGAWTRPGQGTVGGGVSGGVMGDTQSRNEPRQSGTTSIPSGQEIDVRLQGQLSSATAQVEDRFEATTVVDLYRGNEVLIPAGSVLRGVVRTVQSASRTDRKGEMTVSFDQMTIRGRTYPMRGTVTQAIESEGVKGEAARIGTGAGVGAIIGGILGGVKGALLGVLIGGGGTIAATEGKDVTLEPGTILRVRLDTPPAVR